MSASVSLVAAAAFVMLWPRPAMWSRLPRRPVSSRRLAGADPIWWVLLLPVPALLAVGPAAAVAMAMIAGTVIALRRRAARRADAEYRRAEVRRALSVMIAEVSVGAPVVAACRSAAEELARAGPSETGAELSRMAAHAELGGEPEVGVAGGESGLERLSAAWASSASRGLPVIDQLQLLRADLTARAEHSSRTRAGLAGPRATAMVLALLPLLGIGLGQAMGAHPITVLLSPGVGGVLLVLGTGLAVAGVWWTTWITEKAGA
ncbi:type II secretion system F family protein [Gordonia zhaorongruii]|uniref:type II secretion system F family protein n=1 Tax=Gordonia zhaorongruii TaxID=2597659 RepID=UPI001FD498AD|nr:type II secretion system F family protein [Gordonia zhaorongruii]